MAVTISLSQAKLAEDVFKDIFRRCFTDNLSEGVNAALQFEGRQFHGQGIPESVGSPGKAVKCLFQGLLVPQVGCRMGTTEIGAIFQNKVDDCLLESIYPFARECRDSYCGEPRG